MKYELWVYLKKNDFWFKALTTSNQQVLEIKKQRLNNQGHKVKQSINYIGVVNV